MFPPPKLEKVLSQLGCIFFFQSGSEYPPLQFTQALIAHSGFTLKVPAGGHID